MTSTTDSAAIIHAADSQLREAIQEKMTELGIPGANVLVGKPGGEPWVASFGVADTETNAPMEPAMRGRIGSITKPMTATLILQLLDEGALDLDAMLAAILPEAADLPNADRITIRQLLTMRSGLFNYTAEAGFFEDLPQKVDRTWASPELLDIARAHPANFEPGETFEYCNTNYILLGMIVEKLTGKAFGEVLQERILSPFNLTETSWPNDSTIPAPYSQGYERVLVDRDGPVDGETRVVLATQVNPSVGGAAGAVISTLADLNRWIDIMNDGTAVSEQMHAEQVNCIPVMKPDGEPSGLGYGLGIADFGGIVGHNGGIPGFQTFAGRAIDIDVNIAVIANIDHGLGGAQPANTIAITVRDLLRQQPTQLHGQG